MEDSEIFDPDLPDPVLRYWEIRTHVDSELVWASKESNRPAPDPRAMKILSEAAARNDPFALCKIAELHAREGDAEIAYSIANKAANLQFAPARFLLGLCLEKGHGVKKDNALAEEHFEHAAESGFGPAALHLATGLEEGRFKFRELGRIVDLLALGAANDDSSCAVTLGRWYENGTFVSKNWKNALSWYHRAAELNNRFACFRLSMAYSIGGLGLTPDVQKSEEYLRRSEQGGLL